MIRKFKLKKIAGPSGTFAGYVLLFLGIITAIFVISGVPVVIFGLYLSFGYFCATIDADNRRVRSGIMLFGWAISGKWIEIDDTYYLDVMQEKSQYTIYKSSNQTLNLDQTDFKIYIFSAHHSKKIAIALCHNEEETHEKSLVIQDLLQIKKPES
jgi:hypothetical protein